MKYLINVLVLLILIFISLLVITYQITNEKISKKIKIVAVNMIYMMPVISLIGGILFLLFEIALSVIKFNEYYYLDVFIVAIYGIFIILLGDYISKIILRQISASIFSRKYGGEKLTHKEMREIYRKNQDSLILWNYILIFIICGILYSVVTEIILLETNLLIIIIFSLITTISYWILFRKII
ncbi:hypothetical protein [uncultured Clostridium sp.]|uniref:hypothetical protein n=1 Tax=uncultured Clostridium sp. TaxID=59620 RepID=UPI00258879CC|nr:hypothetical protein [uncultured Clostridium sp.]